MRQTVTGFPVSENKPLIMKPAGYHMMLGNLIKPLEKGSTIKLSLDFASGTKANLTIPITNINTIYKP